MPAILKKLPRRKCSVCKKWFHPTRDGQFVCSFDCACRYGKVANDTAKAEAQREKKRVEKVERKRQAERRQAVKPLRHSMSFSGTGIAICHASAAVATTTDNITQDTSARLVPIQNCALMKIIVTASAPPVITTCQATLYPIVPR